LAFLGDSVLGLAITTYLYPRLDPETFGAGPLTKIRAQTVSGPACRRVALRLDVPEMVLKRAPKDGGGQSVDVLLSAERVLASIIEAIIGACYLHFGYERTAPAVVEAFEPEITEALERPTDFKSALQERLARQGDVVTYAVTGEEGPPHNRTFEVAALVDGRELARGGGRSKKESEQAAAALALKALDEVSNAS
jgi:ribonuclease III